MKKKIVAMCATVAIAALAVGGTLAFFTDSEDQTNTFAVGNVDIKLDETIKGEEAVATDENKRTQESQTFDDAIMPGLDFVKDPKIKNVGTQNAWVFLEIDLNKYVSLINLMGVDAYADESFAALAGEYPGFTAFAQSLLDNDLREAVVDRWFGGIEHDDWAIMNREDIEELVGKVATGENPTHLKIVVGYKSVLKPNESATFMTSFGMPESVTQSMMNGDDAYYLPDDTEKKSPKSNFNTTKTPFNMAFTAYAIQEAELDTLESAYAALVNDLDLYQ